MKSNSYVKNLANFERKRFSPSTLEGLRGGDPHVLLSDCFMSDISEPEGERLRSSPRRVLDSLSLICDSWGGISSTNSGEYTTKLSKGKATCCVYAASQPFESNLCLVRIGMVKPWEGLCLLGI